MILNMIIFEYKYFLRTLNKYNKFDYLEIRNIITIIRCEIVKVSLRVHCDGC